MPDVPLAYHITFGTYVTRLHGDDRGTVDRRHNQPGEPILGKNDAWRQVELGRLRFDPLILTIRQRHHIEVVIPDICRKGGWHYRIAAAQPDHVHVLLTAEADGQIVRRLLKRWLSEELSKFWRLQEEQVWWAESGSGKWVWDEKYLENVFNYVAGQRALRSEQ